MYFVPGIILHAGWRYNSEKDSVPAFMNSLSGCDWFAMQQLLFLGLFPEGDERLLNICKQGMT